MYKVEKFKLNYFKAGKNFKDSYYIIKIAPSHENKIKMKELLLNQHNIQILKIRVK